uniref:ribonucleoside-diphosphate reductase n=1 Tax=viral metagenome TaxID=1070528 RepID=A0A6C0E0A3_9ZZZZ
MYVVKRSGNKESVQFDKITNRLEKLLYGGLEKTVDPVLITQKICSRIYSGITTTELDNLASQICMGLITDNPDFGILGGRIVVSNHQKNTDESFYSVILELKNNKDVHGDLAPLINDEIFEIVSKHGDEIQDMIDMNRDYLLDFFGFKTLERSYLLKVNVDGGKTKRIVERPQHLFMRVAIGIHGYDFENVKKTYDNISLKMYTHATPTLFNASTNHPQLSSCFLIDIEDSIEGIFKTYTDCGLISKWAGGIGVHISNIRSKGSYIRKTGGNSDGIMPLLRTFNSIARQFNQCFVPNTMIFTLDGPKEIQHITTKDYVITRDGTYKKVMNVIKNEVDKDILSIRSKYSFSEVDVTPEHEICVLRGCKMMFDKIQQNMSNGTLKTEFISAKCLDENDFLCYPIPETIVNYHDNSDNIRFYGIMLGYGDLSKKYNKTMIEGGVLLGIEHKQNTIIFVENFLKNNDIHYWKTYNDNSVQIHWTHTNLSEKLNFDYDDLYDENHEKIISNKFFHMSKTNTLDLIHGLVETEGSVHNEIYFSSTSKNIAEGMRFLLLKVGILCSGNIRDEIGTYVLRIPKDPVLCNVLKIEPSKKFGYFSFNNTIYSRINTIKTKNYKGLVYDLNIDENHNYLTNMGLVHNSGKRLGSFAMYLEVHHADIFTFLDAKKNHGAEEERARDLFYALWICDLFMERVQENGDWFLMDPNESQNLNEVYGNEYNNLYNRYVNEGKYKKKIKARELWEAIISSQVETGTPYLCYKDHVNKKNNQKNIGIVKSSNLCVSGDTNILIRNVSIMNVPIKYLMNREVEVWNGKQWSQTIIYKTGENQKLLKIMFSNSREIKCTEYHKFYIQENDKEVVYEAKNLRRGMRIIPYTILSEDAKNLTFSDVYVSSIENCLENEDTYCFNEPLEHKGIFNGIITGQCAEINEVSNEQESSVCNLGSICLPQILEYPDFNDISKLLSWKSFLTSEQIKISSYYEEGRLKIYTTSDCEYCKLLKTLLNDCGLSYEEIDKDEAEMLRIKSNPSLSTVKPFETVPQLFSIKNEDDIEHLGGYDDNWSVLSPKINYKKLYQLAYELTYNLNKVIDKNFYPTDRTRVSNMKNRPIGLGVQGLSDVFMRLKIPFTSDKAREINKDIFETLYYGSMESSIDIAKIDGSYPTYEGSPLSKGEFQFNLWDVKDEELSGRWDWRALREKLMLYGTRNSLNIALMPTASTASIFGNNESFEVITSNLYTRNVLSGVFTMVNKYLIKDLIALDLWNQDTKDRLIFDKGSVQNLRKLPKFLREVYKTAFEVDQKLIIKMSAERGIFVCQSQSLNLFFDKPTFKELTACHFYGWKNGLKTGSYYIRTKSALSGQNFGLDPNKEKKLREENIIEEDEGCLNCGA